MQSFVAKRCLNMHVVFMIPLVNRDPGQYRQQRLKSYQANQLAGQTINHPKMLSTTIREYLQGFHRAGRDLWKTYMLLKQYFETR